MSKVFSFLQQSLFIKLNYHQHTTQTSKTRTKLLSATIILKNCTLRLPANQARCLWRHNVSTPSQSIIIRKLVIHGKICYAQGWNSSSVFVNNLSKFGVFFCLSFTGLWVRPLYWRFIDLMFRFSRQTVEIDLLETWMFWFEVLYLDKLVIQKVYIIFL